jgi:hypothetical protein
MNPERIEEEKAKIVAQFYKYLAARPPSDDIPRETLKGLAQLNDLEELARTYPLTLAAARFDIELPDSPEYWTVIQPFGERALTKTGRFALRKMIDEEKIRRREVKAWRWKTIILPVLPAVTGLIGVIIGLVAMLKK